MEKLTQDQFARFIYNIALNRVKNYNFDGFYDIAKIVNDLKEYRSNSEEPIIKTYFLFYRDSGMDLISENCDTYKIRYENNLAAYKISLWFNCDYFGLDTKFATVEKIK